MKNFLVVGSGLSGIVLARQIVDLYGDCTVRVIDEKSHIGGNCYTSRDVETDVMVHVYGPHIFNTNNEEVWEYVNKFTEFVPFINRVKAVNKRGVFSMPINLHTINQFYGQKFTPAEAKTFISSIGESTIEHPKNFEEQALKMIGGDLYEAFFYGYTKKQWGCEPKELPASILKRLPVRFNYDDNYYASKYQGIPKDGYTQLIENIAKHNKITIDLGVSFENGMIDNYDHVFYTGPIDRFFNYADGRLGYRTVTFEKGVTEGDFLGNAVINYSEMNVPYTRVHEHKHFAPWEKHDKSVYFYEFSKETEEGDTPYYPKRLTADMEVLECYFLRAQNTEKVSFIGRLAMYKYINMDQAIEDALHFSKAVISAIKANTKIPALANK